MEGDLTALAAQLGTERARRAGRHRLLVAVLKRLLRRRSGGHVVATTLRRLLRMAGLDPSVSELAGAVLSVGGRYGRVNNADRRRAFVDVEVLPDRLFRVASIVEGQWEKRLRKEGLSKREAHHSAIRSCARLNGGEVGNQIEHLRAKAGVAAYVQETFSAYLELRRHELTLDDQLALDAYLAGKSERDIAAELGLPYETVRDRIARHRIRAGLGLPPRLRRARKYLDEHVWGPEEVSERLIWERYCWNEAYQTIARALEIDRNTVVSVIMKHKLRAGIDLG